LKSPPPPTLQRADLQHKAAKDQEPEPRRLATVVPLALALALVAVTAWYAYTRSVASTPPPVTVPDVMLHSSAGYPSADPIDSTAESRGANAWLHDSGSGAANDIPTLLREASDQHRLLLQRGDQLLVTQPAGLAALPEARRIAGYRRPTPTGREDVAIYQVAAAQPKAVIDHYHTQALAAGFDVLNEYQTETSSRAAWTRASSGEAGGIDLLTVRARRDAAGVVRAVVWLRANQ